MPGEDQSPESNPGLSLSEEVHVLTLNWERVYKEEGGGDFCLKVLKVLIFPAHTPLVDISELVTFRCLVLLPERGIVFVILF